MKYSRDYMDEGHGFICFHIKSRLLILKGKQKDALYSEFKEWLDDELFDQDDVWSIPDLTDEGLCDFFKRAISRG